VTGYAAKKNAAGRRDLGEGIADRRAVAVGLVARRVTSGPASLSGWEAPSGFLRVGSCTGTMTLATLGTLVSGVDTVPGEGGIAGHIEGDQVLVPLLAADVAAVTDQLRVAASLARTAGVSLHVFSPYTGTHRTVSGPEELTATDERALVGWATEHVSPGPVEGALGYTRELVGGILECVRAADVDSLVVPSGSVAGRFRRGLTDQLAVRADCDIITVNGRQGYEEAPSILLAVADGPHSTLATDVAARVAADCDAWIDILHVVGEGATDRRRQRAEDCVEEAARRIDRPESTTTWILEAADVAEAIVEQSAYYGLTVVGAPTAGRLRQFVFGSTNRAVRDDARSVVLSVRRQPTSE
jgi:nucleotide-binding universal stress UspA family protein